MGPGPGHPVQRGVPAAAQGDPAALGVPLGQLPHQLAVVRLADDRIDRAHVVHARLGQHPVDEGVGGGGVHRFADFGDDANDETAFGLNGGVGYQFSWGMTSLFLEGRYISAFTDEENTNYIPVILGMLWLPALRQLGANAMLFLMAVTAGLLASARAAATRCC